MAGFTGWLGDALDNVGTALNLPELGISEGQAGGTTLNTGRVLGSGNAAGSPLINNAYQARQTMNNLNFGGGSAAPKNDANANGTGAVTSTYGPDYAAQNAGAISQLGQSQGTIQSALNRLPGQLDIANANINTQYGQKNNELTTQKATNQNNYNTSTTQNSQDFRGNKNVINDQASNGLRGLQRLLGSYGAVGSDMGLAGRAVSDQASQQNAGAGQNFAQNQSGLDTNWGNYQNEWDNEQKKLSDWKNQQLQSTQAQSLTTRQDLLSKLADISGQMSAARGGNYAGSAQPYLDQANALSGQIDNLGRLNPTYTGNTPQYTAQELSSYDTGNGAEIGAGGAVGGTNTPFLNMLLNRDKKQALLG